LSVSTSVSTSSRVRQNTSADVGFSMSSTRWSAIGLCARATTYATWRTRGSLPAAVFSRAIVMRSGDAGGASAHRQDARRHRGREQRRLPRGGRGSRIASMVLGEAHVEHLVGLVEHEHLTSARASDWRRR
jgi:hypothetical protein